MTAVFAPPDVALTEGPHGTLELASRMPLGLFPRNIGQWLRDGARARPDAVFLADRDERVTPAAWRRWRYFDARLAVDRLSEALLALQLSFERPLAILSPKSVRHGLLSFAAMQVGIPVVPISPAWSLRPEARERLNAALDLTTPGLVYAEDGVAYRAALTLALNKSWQPELAVAHDPPPDIHATTFETLIRLSPGAEVEAAFAAVGPDTVGKIMFTSGSTGPPKAALITHGNMASNQQALRQVWPFLAATPPVVVDWQPWHHCGGGCFNWHAAVANGGAYYCDPGRPTPEGIAATVASLAGLHPTVHFNVPLGYDLLAAALAADPAARAGFLQELRLAVYSAAGMPEALWQRLQALVAGARRIELASSYGMTEMAPMHTTLHRASETAGHIGTPVPGCRVRLIPAADNPGGRRDGRFELRAKGPNISPGYRRQDELTRAAFDEDGWFRSGDLVRLVDPADPNAGLRLDGRIVEQFKLASGTWVHAGDIRLAVLSALGDAASDLLVVGEDRSDIGVLLFPGNVRDRDEIARRLAAYNSGYSAGSRRIARALLLAEAPDAMETTDKGTVNRALALARRAALVERLYGESDPAIIRP